MQKASYMPDTSPRSDRAVEYGALGWRTTWGVGALALLMASLASPALARDLYVTSDDDARRYNGTTGDLIAVFAQGGGLQSRQSCVVPPADMVAWWPLDELAGPTAFDIAGDNDGAHVNGPTPAEGKVAGGLSLDGGDDYVEVPDDDSVDLGVGDLSIDAWIRTTASGIRPIVDKRDYEPVKGYVLFLYNGQLGFEMADAAGPSSICSSNPSESACTNYGYPGPDLADGEWHHVAVTVVRDDTEGGKLFVNGAVVGTFNPTIRSLSMSNGADLWIGRRHPTPAAQSELWWLGEIDEVEIFNRALEDAEIQGIFSAQERGKCKIDQGAIPTVSEWGLIAMTLLLLTGMKIKFGGRRRPATA